MASASSACHSSGKSSARSRATVRSSPRGFSESSPTRKNRTAMSATPESTMTPLRAVPATRAVQAVPSASENSHSVDAGGDRRVASSGDSLRPAGRPPAGAGGAGVRRAGFRRAGGGGDPDAGGPGAPERSCGRAGGRADGGAEGRAGRGGSGRPTGGWAGRAGSGVPGRAGESAGGSAGGRRSGPVPPGPTGGDAGFTRCRSTARSTGRAP